MNSSASKKTQRLPKTTCDAAEASIQKIVDDKIKLVDEFLKKKEEEILEI